MSGVTVVVDSTASLPLSLAGRHGILVIPMRLTFGHESLRDGVDIQPAEFYRRLASGGPLPKTAAPPPEDFVASFKQAADQGAEGVVCLTIAKELSSTYDTARLAAGLAAEPLKGFRINIVDSRTAGGAEGLAALEAARAAGRGASLEEVTATAERSIRSVQFIGVLDTLYYIWKGGRVPRTALWATSLLQIKPILEIRDGRVQPVERPRTQKRAIQRLLALVAGRAAGRAMRVMVLHGDAPREAELLAEEVRDKVRCEELLVSTFPPVIGAHTGPGLLGVAFLPVE